MAGMYERGRTILGEPGLGKSTLVRKIADQARANGDWATSQIRLPLGADPLKAVAEAILKLSDRAGLSASHEKSITDTIQQVRQVAVSGISLTIDRRDGPEPYMALSALLVTLGKAAIIRNVAVLLHIDEMQNITDEDALSQLLIALGDVISHTVEVELPGGVIQERSLPIAVYLTGLPEFAERASSRTGATFARRFATETLGPIDDDDFRFALSQFMNPGWPVLDEVGNRKHVSMTPQAIDSLVNLCRGEPFLFQLAGQRAWYAGEGDVITSDEVITGWVNEAKDEAATHVERILERLPAKERAFVECMAALAPDQRKATNIAVAMGYQQATSIGPFAQRLDSVRGIIKRGRQYSFKHRALEAYLTASWPEIEGVD